MRGSEYGESHVDGDAELVHLVLGAAADEDVVAAFADELVKPAAADEDVVAGDVVEQERIHVVAGRAVLGALLDPVVAFIPRRGQIGLGALPEPDVHARHDEVVALAAENGGDVIAHGNEVFAIAAEDKVAEVQRGQCMRLDDDVVACASLDRVVAAATSDDVVAIAAEYLIVAGAAVEPVVAGVAVKRIVADARDD